MGVSNLGKKLHKIYRDIGAGEWVNGEYVPASKKELFIKANIQPSWSFKTTMVLPSGDRDRRAIWFSSNDWVYEASHGAEPKEADIIEYNGAKWEVKAVNPYGNFGTHCEGVAVLIETEQRPRKDGVINEI